MADLPADSADVAAIGCHGLRLGYGRRRVLDGFSLQLPAGAWTAVVGPNGCGKSTLLRALAGLQPLLRGQVMLDGRPLVDWPRRERACRIAWLAQGGMPSDLRVRDCVALGRFARTGWLAAPGAADAAAIDRAMVATGCAAWADRRLATLSGGERQRVLLARVLASEAAVLLLDEPTTHLDPPHQEEVAQLLQAQARAGACVVSVIHDLSLALAADQLVVMGDHGLVGQGPVAQAVAANWLGQAFGTAVRVLEHGGAYLWQPRLHGTAILNPPEK